MQTLAFTPWLGLAVATSFLGSSHSQTIEGPFSELHQYQVTVGKATWITNDCVCLTLDKDYFWYRAKMIVWDHISKWKHICERSLGQQTLSFSVCGGILQSLPAVCLSHMHNPAEGFLHRRVHNGIKSSTLLRRDLEQRVQQVRRIKSTETTACLTLTFAFTPAPPPEDMGRICWV